MTLGTSILSMFGLRLSGLRRRIPVMALLGGLLLVLGPAGAGAAVATNTAANSSEELRGVWMWSSAVREEGAEAIAKRLADHHMNRVFLLVKGYSGQVCYPSAIAPSAGPDLLKEILNACHARRIQVHAWFVFNSDNVWATNHPGDVMYHAGKADAWDRGPYAKLDDPQKRSICPLSAGYRDHIKRLIREVLEHYDVDGIHLDYIRYGHLCYCFCPRHQALAATNGIDLAKVRKAVYDTYYAPRKEAGLYFKLYRAGDSDITRWVNLREREIDQAVKDIRELVKAKSPSLALSAAFMPEGGENDDSYALCHYAQNYASAGSQLDFILPMTYRNSPQSIVRIARNAERKSHRPVYSGLWASEQAADAPAKEGQNDSSAVSPTARLKLSQEIRTLRQEGIRGFVLFRYGTMTESLWQGLE